MFNLKHSPDANTDSSSLSNDKTLNNTKESSPSGKEEPKSLAESALDIVTDIARKTPGGEDANVDKSLTDSDKADADESRSKSEQHKAGPEGDGEQDETHDDSDETKTDTDDETSTEEDTGKTGDEETVEEDGKEGDDKADEVKDDAEKSDAKDDDSKLSQEQRDAKLPFHNHPRWKEVMEQNKSFKLKADAQDSITNFCREHGVDRNLFQQGLQMMALVNTDPAKAYEAMTPLYESLSAFAKGEGKLPEDLQKAVDAGQLDVAYAKEIFKLRRQGQVQTQRSQQTAEQQFMSKCAQAQKSWEDTKKSSDPDYDKKVKFILPLFEAKVNAERAQGREPNPQTRVKFAEEAWNEVTQDLSSFVPKPPAKKVLQSVRRNGSGKTNKEAESPLDVAMSVAKRYAA